MFVSRFVLLPHLSFFFTLCESVARKVEYCYKHIFFVSM